MKQRSTIFRFLTIAVLAVFATSAVALSSPLPLIQATEARPLIPATQATALPWPVSAQAAIGAVDYGVLASSGEQKAAPIASVAKIVTAIMVLKQKPLKLGEQGPVITLTEQDVASYQNYISQDGSVVPVQVGEQITEYQALQALLLPSSNNMAYSLVNWAFGSIDNYLNAANEYVKNLGLNNTQITDASGFLATTVSSAQDLVVLGEIAVENPVIADIVGRSEAVIPVAGTIRNTNYLLGSDGIVGIKTGHTDEAGGCFLFASKQTLGQKSITIVGAVVGDSSITAAMANARKLAVASGAGFSEIKVATKGKAVGKYTTPWGASANVVPKNDLSMLAWKGSKVRIVNLFNPLSTPKDQGATVGTMNAAVDHQAVSVPLQLDQNLPAPSWRWRIFH